MKYSEFREYLKINEIQLEDDGEWLIADNHIEISKIEEHSIKLPIVLANSPYEFELIKKAIELAETPLSKREEVKKYYLKHNRFIDDYNDLGYINLFTAGDVVLNTRIEDEDYKTKFTEEEIEGLKEKFDTDLRDFELIEVED